MVRVSPAQHVLRLVCPKEMVVDFVVEVDVSLDPRIQCFTIPVQQHTNICQLKLETQLPFLQKKNLL
jgi:hypothetical protein